MRQLGGLDIPRQQRRAAAEPPLSTEISTEQFDWTLKTNVYAPFWIIKAAMPHLRPGSAIIQTASVVAYDPPENLFDYAQTRTALVVFTKVLVKRFTKHGIRVNAVAPGRSGRLSG